MATLLDEIISQEIERGVITKGLVRHPRLGYGRVIGQPGEFESDSEFETPTTIGTIRHPRLGIGRVVRKGARELEDRELEIFGDDTRHLVSNTKEVPFRWVCNLDLVYDDPDNPANELHFAGSGTLVSPNHVLTAGHNLFGDTEGTAGTHQDLEVRRIRVTPAKNGPGSAPFGAFNAASWKFHDNWKNSADDNFDFGLIRIDGSPGSTKFASLGNRPLGWWGDKANGVGTRIVPVIDPPSKMKGALINIAGYPGDKCDKLPKVGSATVAQLAACVVDGQASRQWHCTGTCTTPVVPGKTGVMHYTNDTKGGQSGSPVWLRWQTVRWLIAIHTGAVASSNEGVRMTQAVWDQVKAWM
jgi:V8-like Glu-specific endopeptidase